MWGEVENGMRDYWLDKGYVEVLVLVWDGRFIGIYFIINEINK